MEAFLKLVGAVVVILVAIVGVAALYAFPVKWLWNWLMPSIFALRRIDVFEAWGLMCLAGILFKSSVSAKKSES